jgi:hypothetical protein
MRYPAAEKREIIHLVEPLHLPVRRTLAKLGIPRATFYRCWGVNVEDNATLLIQAMPTISLESGDIMQLAR